VAAGGDDDGGMAEDFSRGSAHRFFGGGKGLDAKLPVLEQALAVAKSAGDAVATGLAEKAWHTNRTLHFNNLLDACVAGFFMIMVAAMALLSAPGMGLLLTRRKRAMLRETEPVWLPDYALAEGRPLNVMGLVAVGCAFGQRIIRRGAPRTGAGNDRQSAIARPAKLICRRRMRDCHQGTGQIYVEVTEKRFDGVNRCC